ncbi:MAG: PD40 domain-containing protein [Saprospiraceae bacterium]|nr:PD40 domain-containing protein [Saprospiraceae bacterium]
MNRNLRFSLYFVLAVLTIPTVMLATPVADGPLYFADYPTLSPDANTVVFAYEGDLWRVPSAGGQAMRITAMDGNETHPRISPDGKWLAFTGTQSGNQNIYLMPLAGGDIQQLTYHEAADAVSSWSWDSEKIYFTSTRYNRMSSYTIGINGGTPKRLFPHYFNNVHLAVEHPDGRLFFNESWESANFAHRKRYKGPYNPDIKSYDPKKKQYKQLTTYEGKDFNVSIAKNGKIYFLSDEFNDEYNLYTFERGKKKRLTKFESAMRRPQVSANGTAVVFRKDYQIFLYKVKGGQAKPIKINLPRNPVLDNSQRFDVAGQISAFDVSLDGKKLAFVSRGELFISDIAGKFIRQVATRADGRVMELHWLKDNKTILFNQTAQGYQNWFTIAADGSEIEKQLTNDLRNNRDLNFNSDRSQAVYVSGRDEIRLLDLESLESSTLVKEEIWGFQNDAPYFGPDDKHVAFTARRDFEPEIMVYHLDTKKTMNLTNTGVPEASPYWSPDGKALYFVSNRTQPSYPYGLQDGRVYRMAFDRMDKPFKSDKFDALFEEKKKEEKKEKEKKDSTESKLTIKINPKGLMKRLDRISPNFGRQSGPVVFQQGDKTMVLYYSNHDEGKPGLWMTTLQDFENPKTAQIQGVSFASPQSIRVAKKKYYILSRGNIHTLNLSSKKASKINIKHNFYRQLQPEFEQMFAEAWANMEENFYNETFHGINWKSTKEKYAAYLPHLNSRGDLRTLINEMLGELNTSHFGFSSNGREERVFYGSRTATAGLLFEEEDPYRVARIITNGPLDYADKGVEKGDRLVAVDGKKVQAGHNREHYFTQPALAKEMTLTFSRQDSTFDVRIHPISYGAQRTLLYDEWIAACQERVDKKTNKQVAYVHMKNMTGGQLQHFMEEMVSDWYQKEALILDLRYNTGGNVHDRVLQFLSQKPYLQWKYREGALGNQSNFGVSGKPIVLLINEQSLSDAEMTTAGFKQLGLGKVVGAPTYRWIIFTSGKGLVDGSFYRLPSWGCYTLDGKNLEKTGVEPDIYVKNTFADRLGGDDPQLDRAIAEIMKSMK